MSFTLISFITSILIRLAALYIALNRAGFWRIDKASLVILSVFSALLGFIMPAGGIFDITGMVFRFMLFSVIVMIFMKMDFVDATGTVVVAAIIESIMITALMLSPASFLVAGMSPLTVP
ncbi:MAG: hypothetical protein J7K68_04330 [Candidatus Diapherotrites archaeon]|nr:hypothetical protein [Candidatus Diapherotrites archaeon]